MIPPDSGGAMKDLMNYLLQTIKTVATTGVIVATLAGLAGCEPAEEPKEVAEEAHDHSMHHHGMMNVEEQWPDATVPTVKLHVERDSMSGWNVQVITEHFRFAPEKVNQDARPNEGHAHLFVDNYKFARLYDNWYHLKDLTPGQHEVKVTLNANDHSSLGHLGQEISAVFNIEQK